MARSQYEASLDALREFADAARTAMGAVEKEIRAPYREQFARLERVLAYTGVVLASADARLISAQAHANLVAALQPIRDNIAASPQSADDYSSAVLNAVSSLPLPDGKSMAQDATSAAQKFARSSRARLAALTRQLNEQKAEATALAQRLDQQRQETERLFAERKAEAEKLVTATRTELEALQQRIESTATEQAELFRSAQDERTTHFNGSLEGFKSQLDKVVEDASQRVDELMTTIGRKDQDASNLLAALGVKGTAGRWAQEAAQERTTANRWRWATVLVVIAAVGMALLAARADSLNDPAFVSKALISAALGGLAGYTARQSGRQRNREEIARRLELELAAFGPFIEPLPPDLQAEVRRQMVSRTLGRPPAEVVADGGPSLVSQISRRQGPAQPDELAG
jgi:hypothetical protein